MVLDLAQVLGWIATILFTIMLVPQIIKTIKVKNTEGVSLLLFLTYLIANIIALIYAFLITQPPLIIKYELGIMVSIFYLVIYFIYSKNNKKK